jgi:hypothetical protein
MTVMKKPSAAGFFILKDIDGKHDSKVCPKRFEPDLCLFLLYQLGNQSSRENAASTAALSRNAAYFPT